MRMYFFNARLFSDALLQIFFFVVQIVGWVAWLRHREPDGALLVERSAGRDLAATVLITMGFATMLGYGMGRWAHAAFPYWDATVASASVVAQVLLTQRKLENWVWWIGADVVSIGVYARKGLYLTSGLYVFFLVMAAWGLVSWRRTLEEQRRVRIEVG